MKAWKDKGKIEHWWIYREKNVYFILNLITVAISMWYLMIFKDLRHSVTKSAAQIIIIIIIVIVIIFRCSWRAPKTFCLTGWTNSLEVKWQRTPSSPFCPNTGRASTTKTWPPWTWVRPPPETIKALSSSHWGRDDNIISNSIFNITDENDKEASKLFLTLIINN